jgi:hypothetical protein
MASIWQIILAGFTGEILTRFLCPTRNTISLIGAFGDKAAG